MVIKNTNQYKVYDDTVLNKFNQVEKLIEDNLSNTNIQAIFSLKEFKKYVHFQIYAGNNQYYNRQKDNTISLFNFSKNFAVNEELKDNRDDEAWYRYVLEQYKKIIYNKQNYDDLKATTGDDEGREQYNLRKSDIFMFECILEMNSPNNSDAIRTTYRKFCLQKFQSINYEELEKLYHFFYNKIKSINGKEVQNLEFYKLESAMRFETIKYTLYKIAEFELKCTKDSLSLKSEIVTKIALLIMKYIPTPFRVKYIDYFFTIANQEMNKNGMSPHEFIKEVSDCIMKDYRFFTLILKKVALIVLPLINKEIISMGLTKYSEFFSYTFLHCDYKLNYNFSKKHYKALMDYFQSLYQQDKKLYQRYKEYLNK